MGPIRWIYQSVSHLFDKAKKPLSPAEEKVQKIESPRIESRQLEPRESSSEDLRKHSFKIISRSSYDTEKIEAAPKAALIEAAAASSGILPAYEDDDSGSSRTESIKRYSSVEIKTALTDALSRLAPNKKIELSDFLVQTAKEQMEDLGFLLEQLLEQVKAAPNLFLEDPSLFFKVMKDPSSIDAADIALLFSGNMTIDTSKLLDQFASLRYSPLFLDLVVHYPRAYLTSPEEVFKEYVRRRSFAEISENIAKSDPKNMQDILNHKELGYEEKSFLQAVVVDTIPSENFEKALVLPSGPLDQKMLRTLFLIGYDLSRQRDDLPVMRRTKNRSEKIGNYGYAIFLKQKDILIIRDYIAKGTSKKVSGVYWVNRNQSIIRAKIKGEKKVRNLLRELGILDIVKKINNPHLFKGYSAGLQGKSKAGLPIFELFGEKFNQVSVLEKAPMLQRAKAMADMADGLRALHAANLGHGDFKPDNLLIKGDPEGAEPIECLISDFGMTTPFGKLQNVGTVAYTRPGLNSKDQSVMEPSYDNWALGATSLTLLLGGYENSKRILNNLRKVANDKLKVIPQDQQTEAILLKVQGNLAEPSLALQTEILGVIRELLRFNPNDIITAETAFQKFQEIYQRYKSA